MGPKNRPLYWPISPDPTDAEVAAWLLVQALRGSLVPDLVPAVIEFYASSLLARPLARA